MDCCLNCTSAYSALVLFREANLVAPPKEGRMMSSAKSTDRHLGVSTAVKVVCGIFGGAIFFLVNVGMIRPVAGFRSREALNCRFGGVE